MSESKFSAGNETCGAIEGLQLFSPTHAGGDILVVSRRTDQPFIIVEVPAALLASKEIGGAGVL